MVVGTGVGDGLGGTGVGDGLGDRDFFNCSIALAR